MNKPQTKKDIKKKINSYIDTLEGLLGEEDLLLTKEGMEKAGDIIHYLRQAINGL